MFLTNLSVPNKQTFSGKLLVGLHGQLFNPGVMYKFHFLRFLDRILYHIIVSFALNLQICINYLQGTLITIVM